MKPKFGLFFLGLLLCALYSAATASVTGPIEPIFRTGFENSTCPNNIVEDGEQCDDNNAIAGDGCAANCRFANCGDGLKDSPYEACDDNQTADGDGCTAHCQVEIGFQCTGQPSTCTTVCGDGVQVGIEGCDQGLGNVTDNDGCSSTCQVEPGYQCSGIPSICTTTCGDGVIAGIETCDQGSGNVADNDGCSSTCQVEPGYDCSGTPSVCLPN